ncbi:hypothetical protein AMJ39_02235 [candidate division TA06 bacterium DG_24]|uniref:Arginine--tRNA ligase n=2 Tax=Bacteria division TA06 TaxID=1156500 RepID=A0A0S8G606_UNCT6|nr:MAG: hypothetical protein AMJ39_02235 [candidate division TA06 bacterium DG_24]KPK68342.1 MAG: hypothetical protein AMJ82_08465 [candidate division TA06 bacterium SM23_40]
MAVKTALREIVFDAICQLGIAAEDVPPFDIDVSRVEEHGDFTTNVAFLIAPGLGLTPREAASRIATFATGRNPVARAEAAGAGFVNLFLDRSWLSELVKTIDREGEGYGAWDFGRGTTVLLEYVSSNPTGPLTVGHGRQAVLGESLACILERCGYDVTREYYFNNMGAQMRLLAESVYCRYRQVMGEEAVFPEGGYEGEYIVDIAREIRGQRGGHLTDGDLELFKRDAEAAIFRNIRSTLARLGIVFDVFYNENSLHDSGKLTEVLNELAGKDLTYEKDGALWFKATDLGEENDRVVVKGTGEPTYLLPDIAYHREKYNRGFSTMIDVLGADHHGQVPYVLAGIRALDLDAERVKVLLHQFVTLVSEGKRIRMSTRKAAFVTLDELIDEVGVDAVKFFFLLRKASAHLDFDIELAKRESDENPVYYVQYAHARISSILQHAGRVGVEVVPGSSADLSLLTEPEETILIKWMARFPDIVRRSAETLEPHRIPFYLMDLAAHFHNYYHRHRVVTDEALLTQARVVLVKCVAQVLRNGLSLIGVSAPESM